MSKCDIWHGVDIRKQCSSHLILDERTTNICTTYLYVHRSRTNDAAYDPDSLLSSFALITAVTIMTDMFAAQAIMSLHGCSKFELNCMGVQCGALLAKFGVLAKRTKGIVWSLGESSGDLGPRRPRSGAPAQLTRTVAMCTCTRGARTFYLCSTSWCWWNEKWNSFFIKA